MVKELGSGVGRKRGGRMIGSWSPQWYRDLHGEPVSGGRPLWSRWVLSGLFLLCSLVLTGPLSAAQDDSKALREQAKKYWEARVKGDWATVYDFLSQEQRATMPREEFVQGSKQRGPWRYLNYKMGGVETSDTMGWVAVEYSAEPVMFPGIKPQHADLWEIWEKVDGKWFPVNDDRAEEFPQFPPSLRSLEEEKAVSKRVEDFWKAREKNDHRAVYQLCDPGFRRQVSAEEWLQKKPQNIYLRHKILWAEAHQDRAAVRIAFEYRPNDPNLSKMEPQEDIAIQGWIKVDGQWYLNVSD